MKKTIIIVLTLVTHLCNAQATTKVLAKGIIYNWQICQLIDGNEKEVYFNFKFKNANTTKSSSRKEFGNIGFVGVEEVPDLEDLITKLRQFANYSGAVLITDSGLRYSIAISEGSILLYDWNGSFIKLSKANAKRLATDIEKSIGLLK